MLYYMFHYETNNLSHAPISPREGVGTEGASREKSWHNCALSKLSLLFTLSLPWNDYGVNDELTASFLLQHRTLCVHYSLHLSMLLVSGAILFRTGGAESFE